jgi:hypothetical protein
MSHDTHSAVFTAQFLPAGVRSGGPDELLTRVTATRLGNHPPIRNSWVPLSVRQFSRGSTTAERYRPAAVHALGDAQVRCGGRGSFSRSRSRRGRPDSPPAAGRPRWGSPSQAGAAAAPGAGMGGRTVEECVKQSRSQPSTTCSKTCSADDPGPSGQVGTVIRDGRAERVTTASGLVEAVRAMRHDAVVHSGPRLGAASPGRTSQPPVPTRPETGLALL